jgi:hypothetical protein
MFIMPRIYLFIYLQNHSCQRKIHVVMPRYKIILLICNNIVTQKKSCMFVIFKQGIFFNLQIFLIFFPCLLYANK